MGLINRRMKIKAFISYTMRDEYINSQLLAAVGATLESHLALYIDLLHNDSIKKQLRVEEELENSHVVILLSSESVKESQWVQRELWLSEKNNLPVLKVCVNSSMSIKCIEATLLKVVLSYKNELTRQFNMVGFPRRSLPLSMLQTAS